MNYRFLRMFTRLVKIFTLLNAKQSIDLINRLKHDSMHIVRNIYRANKAKDKVVYIELRLPAKKPRGTVFLNITGSRLGRGVLR